MSTIEDYANLKDCDIVMKGGITSGVVYPRAAVELSKRYRFRQVGGSSAGAIAAVMVAATEVGRQRWVKDGEGTNPFIQLDHMPTELGSTLSTLFQPSMSTRAPFDAIMRCQEPGRSTLVKFIAVAILPVQRAFGWFSFWFVFAMAPAFAFDVALLGTPGNSDEWWAVIRALLVWVPVAAAIGLVVSAIILLRKAEKAIYKNGFGICNGHTRLNDRSPLPLTDWMEEKLRVLAGKTDGTPVCFGDLWGTVATGTYRKLFHGSPEQGTSSTTRKFGMVHSRPKHRELLRQQQRQR